MSYTLTLSKEPGYLQIEVAGSRTRETLLSVAMDCIAACKEHGYTRLLVDVRRMTGQLPTVDSYQLGNQDLPQLRQGLGLKGAIIDLHENRERFQFLENVAVNAGIDLRFFSAAALASKWLCG